MQARATQFRFPDSRAALEALLVEAFAGALGVELEAGRLTGGENLREVELRGSLVVGE
jgi:hypothetical protein